MVHALRRIVLLTLLAALLPACSHMLNDTDLADEAARKQAYSQCLRRSGGDESRCQKEKSDLLEQEEWDNMESSG